MSMTDFLSNSMRYLSEDDFLVPTNEDTSEACTALSYDGNKTGIAFAAALSMLCYAYLFFMYFGINSPIFKRHPTTLAIYKCVFEIVYVQQYLWLPFLRTGALYKTGYQDAPYNCSATNVAAWLAFITQFSLLASELCFLIISVDLRMAYTNPFTSFKQNRLYFATIIIGVAGLTAILLLTFGDRVYGLSDIGLVWIQSRRKHHSPNYPKVVLFYFPILYIFAYCTWANFQYYRGNERGFSKTVSNRTSIMERSKRYTAAYVGYGLLTFLVEFISFVKSKNSDSIALLPAYLYSFRGLWSLLVILLTNYSDLSWDGLNPFKFQSKSELIADVAQERLLLQPHLNTALRAEVLYFTTQGIMFAAKECDVRREAKKEQFNAASDIQTSSYSFEKENMRASMMDIAQANAGHRSSTRMPPASKSAAEKDDDGDGEENQEDGNDEDLMPNIARNTFMDLRRLQQAQEVAITKEMDLALLDEVENLGMNTSILKDKKLGNRKSVLTADDANRGSTASRASVQNPMAGGIEMNERTSSNRNISTDSAASDSTVKWRDTMDVEFGIGFQESDLPAWKRLHAAEANRASEAMSERSVSTTTSNIRKALNHAISNVFSSVYKEFKFKDFCPGLFAKVRDMHHIGAEDYAAAFETTCREKFSEGRSGAFMFFSSDQHYIVKTTTKDESQTLTGIMPKYVKYLEENPDSLIVRFLGSHCLTMYGVELYFVIMLNVFPLSPLSERYDLKGSWVNRHGFSGSRRTRSERNQRSAADSAPLYQDNDLQTTISLDPSVSVSLAEQIRRDILFLYSLNFMDYSVLIGVRRERFKVVNKDEVGSTTLSEDVAVRDTEVGLCSPSFMEPKGSWRVKSSEDSFKRDHDGAMRALLVEGPGSYYIGIIDILQQWNWTKRIERFFKVYIKRLDGDGLSAIQPKLYVQRFWKRVVLDTFEGLEGKFDDDVLQTAANKKDS